MGLMDKVRVAIFGDFGSEVDELDDVMEDDLNDRNRESFRDVSRDTYKDLKPVREIDDYSRSRDSKTAASKVVNIHANVQMQVVVTAPENFDEAQEICDSIRSNSPVVINLEKLESESAQRIMDFISGACYSLDGNVQRITSNIFLAVPNNVNISNDFKEEIKSKGFIAPWLSKRS